MSPLSLIAVIVITTVMSRGNDGSRFCFAAQGRHHVLPHEHGLRERLGRYPDALLVDGGRWQRERQRHQVGDHRVQPRARDEDLDRDVLDVHALIEVVRDAEEAAIEIAVAVVVARHRRVLAEHDEGPGVPDRRLFVRKTIGRRRHLFLGLLEHPGETQRNAVVVRPAAAPAARSEREARRHDHHP